MAGPNDHTGAGLPVTNEQRRWLACAALMAEAGREAARPLYGTPAGRVVLGQGAGGDFTIEVDRACESAIQEALAAHAPAPYQLVSEESGLGGVSGAAWRVVVDPLDGSLNAKRGLEPFCASIAVADGPTLGDVSVAYIRDYVRQHVFAAVRGGGLIEVQPPFWPGGATAPADELAPGGRALAAGADPMLRPLTLEPSRFSGEHIEVMLLEAGRPDRHRFAYQDLGVMVGPGKTRDMRIRQIGSLALSLCYVATGVADLLVAAVRSRSVDIAAGLLILQEAGGGACSLGGEDVRVQPLDLEKRCAFVAWRAGLDGSQVVERARQLEGVLTAVG